MSVENENEMKADLKMKVKVGGVYRHYKGKEYRVLSIVKHSETLEDLVSYECLYENDMGKFWVRPLDMWLSPVQNKGKIEERFSLIEGGG